MTYGDVMREIARVAGVPPPRLPRAAAARPGRVGKWSDLVERGGKEPLVNSTASNT